MCKPLFAFFHSQYIPQAPDYVAESAAYITLGSKTMHPFEGFLDRIDGHGSVIIIRIVSGDFDPNPETPPVLLVTIKEPTEFHNLYAELVRAKYSDSDCYFAIYSGTEARLTEGNGNEIILSGVSVTAMEVQYDERDFERLAKQNHEWGMSNQKALEKQSSRIQRVRQLLNEQHSRVSVKIQGHELGTTARTLYEQHLSFMARVLAELDA